jgi:hypothetical protein
MFFMKMHMQIHIRHIYRICAYAGGTHGTRGKNGNKIGALVQILTPLAGWWWKLTTSGLVFDL